MIHFDASKNGRETKIFAYVSPLSPVSLSVVHGRQWCNTTIALYSVTL